jgi:hypothetical protein
VKTRAFLILAALFLHAQIGQSENSQPSYVLDCGGSISSNSAFRSIASVGQGSPVGFSLASTNLNHAGFHHGDGSGPASASDTDSDGLTDWNELTGLSFDPNTPSSSTLVDTDGDTHSDATETRTGTNPLRAGSGLRILAIAPDTNDVVVTWLARAGLTYDVFSSGVLDDLLEPASLIETVSPTTGEGPWMEAMPAVTNSLATSNRFYAVQLVE